MTSIARSPSSPVQSVERRPPSNVQSPPADAAANPAKEPVKAEPTTDRAAFRDLDLDANGTLSRLEVGVGVFRSGQGVREAFRSADQFDRDGDRTTTFREFAGTAGAGRIADGLGDNRLTLSGQLDRALPRDATLSPQLRERLLDRAGQFEVEARTMARTQSDPTSPLGRLRGSLGADFAPDAPITLHGVASHFEPETVQAHVQDRSGNNHVFTRDGTGNWVERPDLQALHAAGRTPSTSPGMQTRPDATATFGTATIQANGDMAVGVPDVSRFSHQPRAQPFGVGDTVQVVNQTGTARVATEGQPYVADDTVSFGRISATDGRGNWTVELTNADGTVQRGADGKPVTRTVTDEELRQANNPTLLRDGARVYDATYDRRDPAQRRMIASFEGTPEAAELERTRPGPNAPPAERAAWERRAIEAADSFLDSRMRYPMSQAALTTLQTERTTAQQRVTALDAQIAAGGATPDAALTAERDRLNARIATISPQIAQAERYYAQEASGANIGAYFENGLGQCRQQAIAMQTLMQHLGVDARMTRGPANTATGNYRGEHMWIESTLSDGSHMMVDPTWSSSGGERPGALEPLYRNDPRRMEDPGDTISDYQQHFAAVQGEPRRIDADELAGTRIIT